jgi:hypothetical protein
MSEDFWYIKALVALLCLAALIYDTLVPGGMLTKLALGISVLILVLDARRDRARDFWHSFT